MRCLIKSLLIAIGTSLSLSAVASCPGPVGNISVFSGQIAPFLDDSVSVSDITYAAEQIRPGFADGVTMMTFGHRVEFLPNTSYPGCPRVDAQIYLFAKQPVIYVARELNRGSCRWKAVMDHELLHVQIAQRALDFAATSLQQQVLALPSLRGSADSLQRKGSSLDRRLQQLAAQATSTVISQYTVGNAHLDSPEEGTRMEAMCNASLREFISLKGRSVPSAHARH